MPDCVMDADCPGGAIACLAIVLSSTPWSVRLWMIAAAIQVPVALFGTDAGLGKKARDTGAACAHALGQSALRVELDLQLAGEILLRE